DPSMKQPYSNQVTAYLEQQLSEGVGARVGFVLYQVNNQFTTVQANRPARLYSVPFQFCDKGTNGLGCTGNVASDTDDALVTFYAIPNSLVASVTPIQNVVTNTPNNGTYKTIEFALNKRQSHNYSASIGVGYTMLHDFPVAYPNTPNGPFDYDYSSYGVKATGTYNAPWGLLLSASYRFQSGSNYARTLSVSAPTSC